MAEKEDVYVRYLHQLFRSCDTTGDGLLGKDEISELSDKLQLTDSQFWYIADRLMGDDMLIKVDFEDFKRVFIDLLKQESWQNETEINSQYRSESLTHDLASCRSDQREGRERKRNNVQAVDELCYSSTIRYLRAIWRSLNVGEDGFLDLHDLHSVCQGIGMPNTSDEMVHQLFVSLDEDMDGRVSFDELLHGILRHLEMQQTSRQQQRSLARRQRRSGVVSQNGADVVLIRKSVSSSDITSCRSEDVDLSDDHREDQQQQEPLGLHRGLISRNGRLVHLSPPDSSSSCSAAAGLITASLEASISPSSVFAISRSPLHPMVPFLSTDFSSHLRRAFSADLVWSRDLS